jgi:hypothetical protein
MTTDKCGLLRPYDLSNILDALRSDKENFRKNNRDIAEIITEIKTGEHTPVILENWVAIVEQKTEINNDHIDRISKTEKKILECMK